MGHYFIDENLEDDFRIINDTIMKKNYTFKTNSGVFSKEHVDTHSRLLIEQVIMHSKCTKVLDVGCGYGVVGIVFAKHFNISVDMFDINERAVNLAIHNCELNGVLANVFVSDEFSSEKIEDDYDTILLNPPIRAGKEVCYRLYEESFNHLCKGGSLYIVIHKKHGAKSSLKFLDNLYSNLEILYKKKGLYVVKATK